MRLSGPVPDLNIQDPRDYAKRTRQRGYGTIQWPNNVPMSDMQVDDLLDALAQEDITVAEVGAWSNPISPDKSQREEAMKKCIDKLMLAERVGAKCCVNIAGSCNPEKWDGPHPKNLTPETFEQIVLSVQQIIDAVNPTRTFYTLETMPWIAPDSPESYLQLIHAINRPAFGVHLDPVNMINCPSRLFDTTSFLQDCFAKLGPWIKSCHAKDVIIHNGLTLHIDEAQPGQGVLDYVTFLQLAEQTDPDMPMCLEHLPDQQSYDDAARWLKQIAQKEGVVLK